jgi:head-tail adaptor
MNPGLETIYVSLSEVPDTTPVTFEPAGIWASVEPEPPSNFGEQRITHRVSTRYHPQITLDTVLTTDDDRQLFVRGIQQVRLGTDRLVLLCEEVVTP